MQKRDIFENVQDGIGSVIPSEVEESCFFLSSALRFLDYVRRLTSLGMTLSSL